MSVLINGMEMPVTCCHCQLTCYDPDIEWVDGGRKTQGAYICVITHELIDNTKREEHCPLVPVPPHGDLIDRDALIKDGWLNLHKEIIRLGGYAIHELPLKNPSIPVIIPAEEGET